MADWLRTSNAPRFIGLCGLKRILSDFLFSLGIFFTWSISFFCCASAVLRLSLLFTLLSLYPPLCTPPTAAMPMYVQSRYFDFFSLYADWLTLSQGSKIPLRNISRSSRWTCPTVNGLTRRLIGPRVGWPLTCVMATKVSPIQWYGNYIDRILNIYWYQCQ